MAESTNGNIPVNGTHLNEKRQDSSWTLGPREFVLKYFKYLPWVMIS
jgi:hypothetical protein